MRNVCSEAQNGCSSAGTSCLFACIFLLLQRKMRAMCFSCRRSCASACKGPCLVCVHSMRGVAASPVLAFGECGQLRVSGESLFAGPFRFGSEELFLASVAV